MKRLGWFILAACALIALAIAYKRPADKGPPGEWVVRMYGVGDLVDLSTEEFATPLIVPASGLGPWSSIGTDSRNFSQSTAQSYHLEAFGQLIALVRSSVDPDSWGSQQGSVTAFGRRLVVVQTRQNQESIAGLLDELRAHPPRQIQVECIWARLAAEDVEKITASSAKSADSTVTSIDLNALAKLPGAIAWRGETTCRDGRGARIICGNARTVLVGVNANIDQSMAGFNGNSQQLLDGAVVYFLPSISDDGATVLLELKSEVTRFGETQAPIEFPMPQSPGGASARNIRLDRLNLGVQSIATTLHGPTGAAMLVGGTSDPDAPAGATRRLYLIMRVDVNKRSEK